MAQWSELSSVPFLGRQHVLEVTPRNRQALEAQFVDMRIATVLLLFASILIGALRGHYILVVDAEKKAVAALVARDHFLAVMSHEMRTPLVAMMGAAESLQEGVFGPVSEAQGQALQRIYIAGEHYLELVDDMLVSASIQSGYGSLRTVRSSARSICSEVVSMIRPSLLRKRQELRELGTDSNAMNLLDEAKVKRILLNLLTNASKFTPDGGRVELHFSCTHTFWQFRVRDSGPGVSIEKSESIFLPFEQEHSGLSRPTVEPGWDYQLLVVWPKCMVEAWSWFPRTGEVANSFCFCLWFPPQLMWPKENITLRPKDHQTWLQVGSQIPPAEPGA